MIFMQNNNKKQFFYIENNQIMILSVLEKNRTCFSSAKTGSGFLPEKSN